MNLFRAARRDAKRERVMAKLQSKLTHEVCITCITCTLTCKVTNIGSRIICNSLEFMRPENCPALSNDAVKQLIQIDNIINSLTADRREATDKT